MIILTDAEKDFYKSQHPFTIKKKKKTPERGQRETPSTSCRPGMTNTKRTSFSTFSSFSKDLHSENHSHLVKN